MVGELCPAAQVGFANIAGCDGSSVVASPRWQRQGQGELAAVALTEGVIQGPCCAPSQRCWLPKKDKRGVGSPAAGGDRGAASSDNHSPAFGHIAPTLSLRAGTPPCAAKPPAIVLGDGTPAVCRPFLVPLPRFLSVSVLNPSSHLAPARGNRPQTGMLCPQTKTRLPRSLGNRHIFSQ